MRSWQIGDEFRFIPNKSRSKRNRCLDPNKTFIIQKIQNGSIYYLDNRTNKKCKCNNCNRPDSKIWNRTTGQYDNSGLKQTTDSEIILIRPKYQRQRDISLNILNI